MVSSSTGSNPYLVSAAFTDAAMSFFVSKSVPSKSKTIKPISTFEI